LPAIVGEPGAEREAGNMSWPHWAIAALACLVGIALLYRSIKSGKVMAAWRVFDRTKSPISYWFLVAMRGLFVVVFVVYFAFDRSWP
jgi:hypothetical protein